METFESLFFFFSYCWRISIHPRLQSKAAMIPPRLDFFIRDLQSLASSSHKQYQFNKHYCTLDCISCIPCQGKRDLVHNILVDFARKQTFFQQPQKPFTLINLHLLPYKNPFNLQCYKFHSDRKSIEIGCILSPSTSPSSNLLHLASSRFQQNFPAKSVVSCRLQHNH